MVRFSRSFFTSFLPPFLNLVILAILSLFLLLSSSVNILLTRAAINKLGADLKSWRNSALESVARDLLQWLCAVQSREEHQNFTSTFPRRYLNNESRYRQTE